jgi:hypothetical protein
MDWAFHEAQIRFDIRAEREEYERLFKHSARILQDLPNPDPDVGGPTDQRSVKDLSFAGLFRTLVSAHTAVCNAIGPYSAPARFCEVRQ